MVLIPVACAVLAAASTHRSLPFQVALLVVDQRYSSILNGVVVTGLFLFALLRNHPFSVYVTQRGQAHPLVNHTFLQATFHFAISCTFRIFTTPAFQSVSKNHVSSS